MNNVAFRSGARFPRAWLEPIEQRRVRFALISAPFAEIKAACSLKISDNIARNATLVLANAVLRDGVHSKQRISFIPIIVVKILTLILLYLKEPKPSSHRALVLFL